MAQQPPLPNLMVAPNGARRGKADHAALPITLEEIVDTAVACKSAGADGLHLHVRDERGEHSLDTGLYREATTAIEQAAPDLFVQITSEAAGRYTAHEQQKMVRELRPLSVSIALSEMIRDREDEKAARAFYAWAHDEGVFIQNIVYSPTELSWLLECIDGGVIPRSKHQLQLVLGSYDGSAPSRTADLAKYLELCDARSGDLSFDWLLCAFGSAETACLVHAVEQGGKARVGFENSLWNADGSLARNNAERVCEVRSALDAVGQTLSPEDK